MGQNPIRGFDRGARSPAPRRRGDGETTGSEEDLMDRRRAWTAALGLSAGLGWALGCGGGGGGGGTSAAQITGRLARSGTVQLARLEAERGWVAWAKSLLRPSSAIADGTTACGNPADPASGVPVDLLLSGQVVQSTVTDADGHFRFTDLAPGDYVIQVTLPSGTISAPALVQAGQTTTIVGEFDHDCDDVDADGNRVEISLRVHESTDDGSQLEAEHTEDGGHFDGQIHEGDGSVRHEHGTRGDRSDEQEDQGDDHGGATSSGDTGSSGNPGGASGSTGGGSSASGGSADGGPEHD